MVTRKGAGAQGKSEQKRENSRLGVQVIARAAEILRALAGKDQGLSLGQLAEAVGILSGVQETGMHICRRAR